MVNLTLYNFLKQEIKTGQKRGRMYCFRERIALLQYAKKPELYWNYDSSDHTVLNLAHWLLTAEWENS